MKSFHGTITEASLKTLSELLRRVDLKGAEVPSFNQLTRELQEFKTSEHKTDTDTKTTGK